MILFVLESTQNFLSKMFPSSIASYNELNCEKPTKSWEIMDYSWPLQCCLWISLGDLRNVVSWVGFCATWAMKWWFHLLTFLTGWFLHSSVHFDCNMKFGEHNLQNSSESTFHNVGVEGLCWLQLKRGPFLFHALHEYSECWHVSSQFFLWKTERSSKVGLHTQKLTDCFDFRTERNT